MKFYRKATQLCAKPCQRRVIEIPRVRNSAQAGENARKTVSWITNQPLWTNWAMPAFPIRKLFSASWSRVRH